MARFLFVGLGNPGDQYTLTRHNAGWMVLDTLLDNWSDPSIPVQWKFEKKLHAEITRVQHAGHEIIALKPQTFMNLSGEAVREAVSWHLDYDLEQLSSASEIPELILFYDDLDLELGNYKLKKNSGPKVHNGVNSVRNHLHTENFWYAKIGIDSRGGDRQIPGEAYVLQRFLPEELKTLRTVAKSLAEELFYTVLQ